MRMRGTSFNAIRRTLIREDNITCSRQAISAFWVKYETTGVVKALHGGGRVPTLSPEHLEFLDLKMKENNELNGKELKDLLEDNFDITVSTETVLSWRRRLGWQYAPTQD